MECEKIETQGGQPKGLRRTDNSRKPNNRTAAARQRLSAWTDLLDEIADWRDQVSARLNSVEPVFDYEHEVRTFRRLCDALSVHAPIAHFFHTGKGLELRRLDSDMAVKVMLILRMAGVAVLPVHDSFLVPASTADFLEEMMWEVACEIGLDEIKFGRRTAQK